MQHRRPQPPAAVARAGLVLVALLGILGMHGLTANHDAVAMPHSAPAMSMTADLDHTQLSAVSTAVVVHQQPAPSHSPHHGLQLCLGILAAAIGLLVLSLVRRLRVAPRIARRLQAGGGRLQRAPPPIRRLSLSPFQLSVLRT